MKFFVVVKQVPQRDLPLTIHASGTCVNEDGLTFALNESDACALEEALRLKGLHGGDLTVISAGPDRVASTLRDALARGADRAIHVLCNASLQNALHTAKLLAACIANENPDLIFTGMQSDDSGWGQTGAILAELLHLPHATMVLSTEKTDTGIYALRELEAGWEQRIDLPLPALLAIHTTGVSLRYASLMGIRSAAKKEIQRIHADDLTLAIPATYRLEKITHPDKKKSTVMLTGSPRQIATSLIEKLHSEGHTL